MQEYLSELLAMFLDKVQAFDFSSNCCTSYTKWLLTVDFVGFLAP
jgi:hypothetical protein